MPTPTTYFPFPFATSGDTAVIPQTVQVDGSISYPQGYGPDYELDLLTNPDAQPIGRTTMNQLFLDITTQLQQYSQFGVPNWITSVENLGTSFPYAIYARVRYSGAVYENQVASNTATPGTDNTWLLISNDATGVPTGTVLDYGGATPPTGYLACDGSAVSRSTYGPLMGAIVQTQTGTTINTMNTITGLTSTAQMYAGMPLESANFAPGTIVAAITSSTSITASTTATASSSVSFKFFNWGNGDGSTTFNVPDLRRKTTIGQGGSGTAIIGNIVGQSGGEEAHTMTSSELVAHSHTVGYQGQNANATGGTGPWMLNASNNASFNTGTTGSTTPFNVMQPSAVTYKIIKT